MGTWPTTQGHASGPPQRELRKNPVNDEALELFHACASILSTCSLFAQGLTPRSERMLAMPPNRVSANMEVEYVEGGESSIAFFRSNFKRLHGPHSPLCTSILIVVR